jgi:hypothetical protein
VPQTASLGGVAPLAAIESYSHFRDSAVWTADPASGEPMLHTLKQVEYYDAVPRLGGIIWDRHARHIAEVIAANAAAGALPEGPRSKWLWLQGYWNQAVGRFGILPKSSAV